MGHVTGSGTYVHPHGANLCTDMGTHCILTATAIKQLVRGSNGYPVQTTLRHMQRAQQEMISRLISIQGHRVNRFIHRAENLDSAIRKLQITVLGYQINPRDQTKDTASGRGC